METQVAAYDRIAPEYARISEERRAYLDRIEQLVIAESPEGACSLLDIGAGDATRSFRIIEAVGVKEFVLLEPSAGMRAKWPHGAPAWPIAAEELYRQNGAFDVIICLWNVLGHVFPRNARVEVLRQCARLLSIQGLGFVDVNHRYNASHYGYAATLARFVRDRVLPNERNGDVTARWKINSGTCATRGHVFTDAEFRRMTGAAGLAVKKVFAVDYRTGEVRGSKFAGNLLYVLQRIA